MANILRISMRKADRVKKRFFEEGLDAAMERVLDVYRRPYNVDIQVVCMDETPRQLIRETRTPIPAYPGQLERHDYEYERRGICNVFMASEPLAGTRMTKVTEHKTKVDWAQFLQDIAERYQDAKKITLVMGNLNTHSPGALYQAFPEGKSVRKQRNRRIFHISGN